MKIVKNNDDYGFYGSGIDGYVHYMQGVEEAQKKPNINYKHLKELGQDAGISISQIPKKSTDNMEEKIRADKKKHQKLLLIGRVEGIIFIIVAILVIICNTPGEVSAVQLIASIVLIIDIIALVITIWIDTRIPHWS